MDWSWALEGITEEVPRTTGPECINYMTNRRRWIEAIFFTIFFLYSIYWAVKRIDPIILPPPPDLNRPHSPIRLFLLIAMTLVFGIELGFKFAGKSMLFVLNPCHIQTVVQIYLLASKPSKTTIALFRIQMNNLNGPFLAFLFPEVESRTFPFEQATYWLQHALLYIIPVYIVRSGAYTMEDLSDFNWATIGVANMLVYHFLVLNGVSILTDINMNHMLCPAIADPFQGQHYRIAAVIHESILCPILNKLTVFIFSTEHTYSFTCYNSSSKPMNMPLNLQNISKPNQMDDLYNQCKEENQEEEIQIKETSQRAEMSLAAEMAAAMGQPIKTILTHRLKHIHAANSKDSPLLHASDTQYSQSVMTADCSISTTKID